MLRSPKLGPCPFGQAKHPGSQAPQGSPSSGFTLIEMLVATAILSMLMVMLATSFSYISKSVSSGMQRADNFSKVRIALDLIRRDIEAGIFQGELGAFPDVNGNGASDLVFFSRQGVSSGDRTLALVGYRLSPISTEGALQRATVPALWTSLPTTVGFGVSNAMPFYSASGISSLYENIIDGVVAFNIFFVNSSGISNSYTANSSSSLGVSLAVVDEKSFALLRDTGKLAQLKTALNVAPVFSNNETFLDAWQTAIDSSSFFDPYPELVKSGLQTYERYIPLR
jgi:prepilin-type N-terminal cleavage/methylation domain-containing protein